MGSLLYLLMALEGGHAYVRATDGVDQDGVRHVCVSATLGDYVRQVTSGRRYSPHVEGHVCLTASGWSWMLALGTELWCWDRPKVCSGVVEPLWVLRGGW